jgi:Rod binding domain-containing protein
MDTNFLPTSLDQGQSNALAALAARTKTSRDVAQVEKTAKEFERLALSQMLALMETDTDLSDSMFGGGAAERTFKPFLTDEYARGFSERGGIGIAEAVKREMIRLQEGQSNAVMGGN